MIGRVLEVLRRRLALRAVVADARAAGLQLGQRVAGDDPVEVGVAERPGGRLAGRDEQLGAARRSVDDRGQGDGLLGADAVAELVEEHGHGHQSSGSMNSRIVPPHVRPTANASSSL